MQRDADLEIRNNEGATALYLAARFGNLAIVNVLLGAGADVDAKFLRLGLTVLMVALLNGHTIVVNVLLDNGADIGAVATDGSGVLHMAVISGKVECVQVCRHKP